MSRRRFDEDDEPPDDESAWDEAEFTDQESDAADEDDEFDSWSDDGVGEEFDEDDNTIPCPYCSRMIHEDSPRCPHCESYVSQEDSPPARKPRWIIIGIALSLVVVFLWLRFG